MPTFSASSHSTDAERIDVSHELGAFIQDSPTPFHAVRTIRRYLDEAGFAYLPEGAHWNVEPGTLGYTVRNNSSIVAFRVGANVSADNLHFQMTAAHCDSPTFKLKAEPILATSDRYARLNVEAYGGVIDSTWFDRPLGLAGRLLMEKGTHVESVLIDIKKDMVLIPSVAIHFNRQVNEGYAYNRQVDLCPLFSPNVTADFADWQLKGALVDAANAEKAIELACEPDGAPDEPWIEAEDAPSPRPETTELATGSDALDLWGLVEVLNALLEENPLSEQTRAIAKAKVDAFNEALSRMHGPQEIRVLPDDPFDVPQSLDLNHMVDPYGGFWLPDPDGDDAKGYFDGCEILGYDLFLVNHQEPRVWGPTDDFFSSPKLDDLQCAFASLKAFLLSDNPDCVSVYACFDNEEVGSNTKQGAMSTVLRDTLVRVNLGLGGSAEGYLRAIAKSFLVSCDNAHAVHPNHPEKTDEQNCARINFGIVIKESANQKYTTDAFSRAVFKNICKAAGIPTQTFANRSDTAGGSTLGNLSNTQVSLHAVDVGLPQLAMHSSYETTGSADTLLGIEALTAFFDTNILIDGSDCVAFEHLPEAKRDDWSWPEDIDWSDEW